MKDIIKLVGVGLQVGAAVCTAIVGCITAKELGDKIQNNESTDSVEEPET